MFVVVDAINDLSIKGRSHLRQQARACFMLCGASVWFGGGVRQHALLCVRTNLHAQAYMPTCMPHPVIFIFLWIKRNLPFFVAYFLHTKIW